MGGIFFWGVVKTCSVNQSYLQVPEPYTEIADAQK